MPSTQTVVIVGGGVIGLSAAYQLAKKRAGRVILLDKGPVGDGSSLRAAGITTGLLWTETGVAARQIGIRIFEELSEELPGYTYYNRHGCLNLFSEEQWREREQLFPLYDRLGTAYEILDAAEIQRRWPALHPPSSCMGLLDPLGGYSEPAEYVSALKLRSQEMGVEIREGQRVTSLERNGSRVTGVRTETELIEADAVICAAHAWAPILLNEIGARFPVKYFVHQRYVTEPLEQPLDSPPVNANSHDGYIRPASGDCILLGASTLEREEFRVARSDFHMSELSTPLRFRDSVAARLANLIPVMENVKWSSEHIGLLAFSVDQEPIVGPVGQLPGLFMGISFHSGGFSYNTVGGLLLAESVIDGRTSIDIDAFSPDRFSEHVTDEFLGTMATQGQMENRRH
jgi:sarcosine oxidase subunit beta